MRTSELLKSMAGEEWERYVKHDFVVELREGRLPRDVFRYYLIQDAKYVAEMQRAVLLASSRAPLEEAISVVNAVFGSPLKGKEVHEQLYSSLGITDEELSSTGFNMVNYAYTRHLLYYASQGWPEFLAAWAPCMWGYSEVGAFALNTPDPVYRRWAEFYASEDYNSRVRAVLNVLDRYAVTPQMEKAFITSVRFEIMFWEAAMRKDPTTF
ncbi:MAG: TenA family protein [Acidilobus sp.]